MAFICNDRVKETTATTGTGTITLAGAVTHFEAFSAIGNTNTTYYCIVHENTSYDEWEVGYGVYTLSGTTLTRTAVTSSNGDALVSFTAGTKSVFCTLPANKCVIKDTSGNLVYGDGSATGLMTSLASDTSPQLGGDLDVDSNSIVSTSDGNIAIAPNGTGEVVIGSGADGDITTSGAYDLILDTNSGTNSGSITLEDSANGDITLAANGTGLIKMTANSVTGDVIPGKFEGTNFTDSLIVGHSTTGTLGGASRNTAVGIDSMDAVTSGDDNVCVGWAAGGSIVQSYANVFVGAYAGDSILGATSFHNVAVGYKALEDAGHNSIGNVVLGSGAGANALSDYNILIGRDAGSNLTTGDGNIVIGKVDTAAIDSARTLKIVSYDGSTTTTHITGDGNDHVEVAVAWNPTLSTTGKALVMGF